MVARFKTLVTEQIGFSPIVVLIAAGLVVFLSLNLVLKKSLTSPWGLIAPLLVGICLETFEIWSHYKGKGLFADGNDSLLVILGRHSVDVVSMLAIPGLLVLIGVLLDR